MRATILSIMVAGVLTAGVNTPAFGQTAPLPARALSLSGPRVGVTMLGDGVVEKLAERQIEVGAVISQFGWQFEKQFFNSQGGFTAVTQWVGLLGGLEESVAIPSLTWLIGLRSRSGVEFGVGPNITPAGAALAMAGGLTVRAGVINVPLNVAYVPSKAGARVTVLTGFSLRRIR
jgi:hypothetical protein